MLKCDICTSRKNGLCKGEPYETCEDADKRDIENYKNATLRIDMDRHPMSKHGSRRFAETQEKIKQVHPTQQEVRRTTVSPESAAKRFEALRKWRAATAKALNWKAYYIFSDRDLHALAAANVTCQADLLAISGVGLTKYNQYGEAVYNILKSIP